MNPTRVPLPNDRWHFQHGPIDLIIGGDGDEVALSDALERCWQRFAVALGELVSELPVLKTPIAAVATYSENPCRGLLARRMWESVFDHREQFITPMAAVAGCVADEMIEFFRGGEIRRAYVNNGGDIAFHLAPDQHFDVGVVDDLEGALVDPVRASSRDGAFRIPASSHVRGIATSGWRGRSFSLGIADSVTILARTAGTADAAATMVANAVNIESPLILRVPASSLKDDTDLGALLVTQGVARLPSELVDEALANGQLAALALIGRGLIESAVLSLQGRHRVCGTVERRAALGSVRERPSETGLAPARGPALTSRARAGRVQFLLGLS